MCDLALLFITLFATSATHLSLHGESFSWRMSAYPAIKSVTYPQPLTTALSQAVAKGRRAVWHVLSKRRTGEVLLSWPAL